MKDTKRFRGFLTINYDEGDPSSFKGITLKYGDKIKEFATGDPVVDFYNYHSFMLMGKGDQEGIAYIIQSSSIDSFFRESDQYELRSMTFMGGEFVLLSENVDAEDIYPIVIDKQMTSVYQVKDYVKSQNKI